MLSVKNIAKRLPGGKLLLKDISFEAQKGEFIGILGKSGVGKTVLLRCINGLTAPDSGEVFIKTGESMQKINGQSNKELRQVRQRVGVIFQSFNLVKRLSVLENAMTGRLGQINTLRSLFYGFTNQEVEMALEALQKVGVEHLAERRAETLSGGEMQRVAIAKALMQQPCLLLADEPVANLDPKTSEQVLDYLKPLLQDMAILGVFHAPNIIRKYCTRAIAIKDGLVVYDGSPDLSESDLEYIYGEHPRECDLAPIGKSA